MCGRYTFIAPAPAAEQRFDAKFVEPAPTTYNAAPSQRLPVITNAAPGQIQLLNWGLVPAWSRDPAAGPKPINARAETLAEKPSFRTALTRRRCLIPADGFYEWQAPAEGSKAGKTPTYLHRKDSALFAFAGLWDEWYAPDGSPLRSCTIITTTPNSVAAAIHDRMPVILRPEDEAFWLDSAVTDSRDLLPLLVPYPSEEMESYPVSRRVNVPVSDDPELLARV